MSTQHAVLESKNGLLDYNSCWGENRAKKKSHLQKEDVLRKDPARRPRKLGEGTRGNTFLIRGSGGGGKL